MLKLEIGRCASLAAVALATGLMATAASAQNVYSWRTVDGVYAFTNDPRYIPLRHRGAVVVQPLRSLDTYERFTPVVEGAGARHAERLAERLSHLRALNGAPAAAPSGPAMPSRVVVRIDRDDVHPEIEVSGADEAAPVVVETVRLRDRDSRSTRHDTIVRQGDRILSIVKPAAHAGPPYRGDEQALETSD